METDGVIALKIKDRRLPIVDANRCTGCGRCVAACLKRCITLNQAGYRKCAEIVVPERCNCCGACIVNCPVMSIEFSTI